MKWLEIWELEILLSVSLHAVVARQDHPGRTFYETLKKYGHVLGIFFP